MLADFAFVWETFFVLGAVASPVVAGVAVARLGVRRRTALLAGVAAFVLVLVCAAAVVLEEFSCWYEDPSAPAAYWWSPRERFCDPSTTWVDHVPWAFLLVPAPLVVLGAWLWTREQKRLGGAAWALLLIVPLLPSLYVEALPRYRKDRYPILHSPVLRPADAKHPARACFTYGIVHSPKLADPDDPRMYCVEFAKTPQADALRTTGDTWKTGDELRLLGGELTRKGLPIHTGHTGRRGLIIVRAVRLPARRAHEGARPV